MLSMSCSPPLSLLIYLWTTSIFSSYRKSLKESLAKRKQQSLEEKQSAKRAKLATPVVISGEDISIESSGSSKSTRSYSEVARLPLSPIAGNTRLTKGKMSHQMPYYTSQRIQQQKQLQQQQQVNTMTGILLFPVFLYFIFLYFRLYYKGPNHNIITMYWEQNFNSLGINIKIRR